MSRRSRNNGPSDSLDLLLDTMCNAFGGIVIIAILVALRVNNSRKGETPTPDPHGDGQKEDLGEVILEITGLNAGQIFQRKRLFEFNGLVVDTIACCIRIGHGNIRINERVNALGVIRASATAMLLRGLPGELLCRLLCEFL